MFERFLFELSKLDKSKLESIHIFVFLWWVAFFGILRILNFRCSVFLCILFVNFWNAERADSVVINCNLGLKFLLRFDFLECRLDDEWLSLICIEVLSWPFALILRIWIFFLVVSERIGIFWFWRKFTSLSYGNFEALLAYHL